MKKLLLPGLLLASVGLHSCEDKDFYDGDSGGVPLEPGTEVSFSAGLADGQAASRTVYGKEENNAFPIYWNYSTDEDDPILDRIFIHSPEAAVKIAEYKVKPSAPGGDKDNPQGYAAVVKVKEDGDGVVLGPYERHSFYGFYPSSQVLTDANADGSGDYISGIMPMVQDVTCSSTPQSVDNIPTYIGEHNMNYCFMIASLPNHKPTGPIRLQFSPWSTVLDITLPGPTSEDKEDSFTITDLRILSLDADDKTAAGVDIAGTFKYVWPKADDDNGTLTVEAFGTDGHTEPAHTVTVTVNDRKGVKLGKGQQLNLKAFLLPVSGVTGIRIEVYAEGNRLWHIDLRDPGTSGRVGLLTPGKIHKVTLPNVTTPWKDEYSSWMTELSDDILVSEMSIPGSYDSFTYDAHPTDDEQRIQSITIPEQFEAGIRAFNARVKVYSGKDPSLTGDLEIEQDEDETEPIDAHLGITWDGTTELRTLGEAIHILHQEMESRGNKEFCVLRITNSDQLENRTLDITGNDKTNRNYYKLLKAYSKYMEKHKLCKGFEDNIDWKSGTVQLGQVRGSIFLTGLISALVPEEMNTFNRSYASDFRGNVHNAAGPLSSIQRFVYSGQQVRDRVGNYVQTKGDADWGIGSWKKMEGAPMLMTWTVDAASPSEVQISPLSFGNIGEAPGEPDAYDGSTSGVSGMYRFIDNPGLTDKGGWMQSGPLLPVDDRLSEYGHGLAWIATWTLISNAEYKDDVLEATDMWGYYLPFFPNNKWLIGHASELFVKYDALTSTGTKYDSWYRENGNSPEQFTWWIRADRPWDEAIDDGRGSGANKIIESCRNLWDNYKAADIYRNLNGRVFFTTDIATAGYGLNYSVTTQAGPQTVSRTSRSAANYWLLTDMLYRIAPDGLDINPLENGDGESQPTYTYNGTVDDPKLAGDYNNPAIPLGIWFMSYVPSRDVNLTTGNTALSMHQHRHHVRQMIRLLITKSQSCSKAKYGK